MKRGQVTQFIIAGLVVLILLISGNVNADKKGCEKTTDLANQGALNNLDIKKLTIQPQQVKIESGKFFIDGVEAKRIRTLEGGFIYDNSANLYVVRGKNVYQLKTLKGGTLAGLGEIQDLLLQAGIKDARYFLGDVGKTTKAYFIDITMGDKKINRFMLDGGRLIKVDPTNTRFMGAKMTPLKNFPPK